MLKIYQFDKSRFINSEELYKKLGLSPQQYARWYNTTILRFGVEELDYLDKEKHINKFPLGTLKKGRKQREFYINIYFVIGLCLVAKTNQAKKIRLWILSIL